MRDALSTAKNDAQAAGLISAVLPKLLPRTVLQRLEGARGTPFGGPRPSRRGGDFVVKLSNLRVRFGGVMAQLELSGPRQRTPEGVLILNFILREVWSSFGTYVQR